VSSKLYINNLIYSQRGIENFVKMQHTKKILFAIKADSSESQGESKSPKTKCVINYCVSYMSEHFHDMTS